jgi:hypothetical protein
MVLDSIYGNHPFLSPRATGMHLPAPMIARYVLLIAGALSFMAVFCWVVLLLLAIRRDVNRHRGGQCLRCGYDLRHSRGRCPECGEPFQTPGNDSLPIDSERMM